MIIVKSVFFVVLGMIIPYILGQGFCGNRDSGSQAKGWIYGWLLLFGVFELLALPAYFFSLSADTLMVLYAVALLLIVGIAGIIRRKKIQISVKSPHMRKLEKWEFLGVAVIILIAVQVLVVVVFSHVDNDDAFYVGTATTTYFTNTINRFSPYTGEVMAMVEVSDYLLSPLPVFWGILSRLLTIHPAYLMHTVLPIVLIPMAYVAYWLLGKELFPEDRKRQWLFLGFVALINLFGGFSVRSTATFLLFRIWQGKAVLCNVMIPLYFYFFLRRERGDCGREWYLGIWMLTFASCLVSFTSVLINPVLLGLYWIVRLLNREKWTELLKLGATVLPYLVLGIFYAVVIL